MKKLEFSTEVSGKVESVSFVGAEEIDAVLVLLETNAMHFLPDTLRQNITTVIGFVTADQPAVVSLYERQVFTLFDTLARGTSSVLHELIHNSKNIDGDPSTSHSLYYDTQRKALRIQSLLMPIVVTALLNSPSIIDIAFSKK